MPFGWIKSEKAKDRLFLLLVVVMLGASVMYIRDRVQRRRASDRLRDAQTHAELGAIAFEAKQYDVALNEYRQAIEIEPNADRYYGLGFTYHATGDLKSAIAAYQKAIEFAPTDAKSYHQMGVILADQKQYDDAQPYLQKAIELAPDAAVPHGALGIIYYEQGQLEAAAREFQAALQLDPENKKAKKWLETVVRELDTQGWRNPDTDE